MLFKIEAFKGVIPRLEPHLLPANGAQTALDCRLDSGSLRPLKDISAAVATPSKVGTKKSIHLFGGQYWFHWITDADCIRGPIATDAAEVTYFTGDGPPKVTDSSIAVQGGGTGYPTNAYLLGVPAPTSPPTGMVHGASSNPTQAEDRAYVVTFVAVIGSIEQEGPNSPASGVLVVEPSQTVSLALPAVPDGAYNFTKKRIYRTASAGTPDSTEYKLVAEVTAATQSYTDSVATNALGSSIQSITWDPPPSDLHSLKLHPGGFAVGASGLNLCVSIPYQLHAWPTAYRIAMDYPIVGIGIYGTNILVATTGMPYVVAGTEPGSLSKERLEIRQSCVSKRGIVDMGYAVAYPSPDGLMIVGLGVMKNATEALMKRSDWQAFKPSSIQGAFHDGKYIGFYDNGSVQGGFILDPITEDLTFTSTYATAAYEDATTDTLYLQVGNDIVAWEGGGDRTYTWKSKKIVSSRPMNPACAKVLADSYPVTFKLYADGTLKHTQAVASRDPFNLPSGYLADRFEVELTGTDPAHTVIVAESLSEMKAA